MKYHALVGQAQIFIDDNNVVLNFKLALMGDGGGSERPDTPTWLIRLNCLGANLILTTFWTASEHSLMLSAIENEIVAKVISDSPV